MRDVRPGEDESSWPAELMQGGNEAKCEGAILMRVVGPQADDEALVRRQAARRRTRGGGAGDQLLAADADDVRALLGHQVLGQRVAARVLGDEGDQVDRAVCKAYR